MWYNTHMILSIEDIKIGLVTANLKSTKTYKKVEEISRFELMELE